MIDNIRKLWDMSDRCKDGGFAFTFFFFIKVVK